TERPQDGLDAVQTRLRKAKASHEQLANYFKERAHIEDMYAKNITKAFQKHFITDPQVLGTFASTWDKLNAESVELATLHGQFSLRISSEIEKTLREFTRSSEWQALLAETNCHKIAKEYDEKQLKVTKYTKAVEKVTGKKAELAEQKLSEYGQQLDHSRSAWKMEGPVILQRYQALDQNRLDQLKQVISSFEAIQTEIALQIAEMSNRTSSSAAEFEPIMDIELFASEASTHLQSIQLNDGSPSTPVNGDTLGSLEPRPSNGTHKRGLTGSSQLSNISYSTDKSVPISKASSEQFKVTETHDHVRTESSVLGSALDVPTNHVDSEGFSIPPPDHGPWSDAGTTSVYDDERSETSSFSQAPKMQMEIRQDSVSESNDEARAALEKVSSTLKQTKTISRRHPGRREVRSMYQSEDSLNAFNSIHSSPMSSSYTPDSPFANSPASRVISASGLHQSSTAFSPANSRASTLGIPSSPSQSHFNPPVPPTPPVPHTNGVATPVTALSTSQIVSVEPESNVSGSLSSPGSPLSAFPTSNAIALSVGQKQKWVVSVIEKVNVHTQSGEIAKMMVTGDVLLTLEGTEINPDQPKKAILRLSQLHALERFIPNQSFLAPKEDEEGAFWVNLEVLSQNGLCQGQGIPVLKYQVKTEDDETKRKMIPLLVQPNWKCEPHQTSLLINYKANTHCSLSLGSQLGDDSSNDNVLLSELSFLVPITGEVLNVQSKPTGVWSSDSNKMLWDVDNVIMSKTSPEPHKLLARFEMNPSAGASQQSPTAVKFRVHGRLLSEVGIHFEKEKGESEGEEALGQVRLQVQSGRYVAIV
ncbi:hypothetical protein BGZ76_000503, partial [Entomortierella beljakovae]